MRLKEVVGMIVLALGVRREVLNQPDKIGEEIIDRRLEPVFARMQQNSPLLRILEQTAAYPRLTHTRDGLLIKESNNIINLTEDPRFVSKLK